MNSSSDPTFCSFCKKETQTLFDHSQGTEICSICGLVLEERTIDFRAESQSFYYEFSSQGSKSRRTGNLNNIFSDQAGLKLSVPPSSSSFISGQINKMNHVLADRPQEIASSMIRKWSSLLNIPKLFQDKAREEFDNFYGKIGSLKGYSYKSVIAAFLYRATRDCATPLSLEKILNVTQVPRRQIMNASKMIDRFLLEEKCQDACKYTSKLCLELNLDQKTASSAYKIVEDLKRKDLLKGKNVRTMAAASVCFAMKNQTSVSIKDISVHSKTGKSTIQKSLDELEKSFNL